MTEEQDIDDIAEERKDDVSDHVTEKGHDIEEAAVKPSKRFVGYKTLTLASLIAALLGAGGGTAFSKLMVGGASDLTSLQSKIEAVQSENDALKAQMMRLQRDIKKTPTPAKVDLSGLRSRLQALETAEPKLIESASPPIDAELVARLEALQNEGSEALDLSDIIQRLDKLESGQLAFKVNEEARRAELLADMKAELAADDTFLQNLGSFQQETSSGSTPTSSPDSTSTTLKPMETAKVLPSFPKREILSALDKSDSSKSWIKRTLDKNITVQSEDNPRYLVELIEIDLKNGNLEGAMAKYDKLPSIAKNAGKAWRDAIKG